MSQHLLVLILDMEPNKWMLPLHARLIRAAGGDARTSSPTLDMEWVQALEAEDPKRMGHGSRTNKHARRALGLVLLLGRRGQLIALLPDMDQLNLILRGLVN